MEIFPLIHFRHNQEGSDYPYQVPTENMYSSKYTTMANPDLQIRQGGGGGRSSRPWDRETVSNFIFRAFGPQFGLK